MTLIGWSGRIDPDGNTLRLRRDREAPNNDSTYSNAEGRRAHERAARGVRPGEAEDAAAQAEQIYVVDDPARVWFRFGVVAAHHRQEP